jgi:hypothetical protein
MDVKIRFREFSFSIRNNKTNKDHLGSIMEIVTVGAFCESTGISQERPSLSLVACAFEILRINKCFCKIDGVTVEHLPILGQSFDVQCKNTRSKVRYTDIR